MKQNVEPENEVFWTISAPLPQIPMHYSALRFTAINAALL
jgi:hypothetical protein